VESRGNRSCPLRSLMLTMQRDRTGNWYGLHANALIVRGGPRGGRPGPDIRGRAGVAHERDALAPRAAAPAASAASAASLCSCGSSSASRSSLVLKEPGRPGACPRPRPDPLRASTRSARRGCLEVADRRGDDEQAARHEERRAILTPGAAQHVTQRKPLPRSSTSISAGFTRRTRRAPPSMACTLRRSRRRT